MATWAGPPKSYTKGRSRPVQYVVIHSTEGSEGINSAEAGVAYDKVRTDGTSTHLFVDTDTALMEVRYSDTAHAARAHGNACGIQVELCGRAGQTDAQWHDAASRPMLRLAAREVAAICREFGLPVRRLSVPEVRAAYYAPVGQRPKGICGHIDVTRAYPEDQGSHTDPGPNFPWTEFLSMVSAEMGGSTGGDDDMPRAIWTTKGYWLCQGGTREPINDADDMAKVTEVYGKICWPAADTAGFPVPQIDLPVNQGGKGWTWDEIDRLLGRPYAPSGGTGTGLSEEQVRDIAEEEAAGVVAGTKLVPPAVD